MKVLLGTAVAALVCSSLTLATMGSGTTSTLVGPPATFESFKVKRKAVDGWEVEVEAKQGLKIATQTITFQPGGQSGWHTHPGPVFISVKEGTMTFYDENCGATVRMAGEGFLDTGDHPHLARNETGSPATNVVTYFAPPAAVSLRIDAPQPQNCHF
ncbi:MAG TPA: cupin domain-containing protein [Thermoanaerobaculia bacterium]|nr:cupin domain-containing protein [Thermoanaerobaculia bacterium]